MRDLQQRQPSTDRLLVPAGLRPHLHRIVAAGALWALAWTAGAAATGNGSLWPDSVLDPFAYRAGPALHPVTSVLVGLSRPAHAAAVLVVLLALCALTRSVTATATMLGGLVLAMAVTEGIKAAVGSARTPGGLTFPSGHATAATAIAVFVALVAAPSGPLARRISATARRVLVAAGVVFAAAVSAAVVVAIAHRTSDVLAGAPIGGCAMLAAAGVADAVTCRRHPPPSTV